tara:strand:- start:2945 stop:3358 length:414 start_codon:yes stop_codon:yes gene_type:complete
MSINNCRIIDFPKVTSSRGSLTFIEDDLSLPFDVKRVFYIYDVPSGESRGSHAHKKLEEIIICLSGSFSIELDDGYNQIIYNLNRPWEGLHLSPLTWFSLKNFCTGSICLVLCSDKYDEDDYIRDYNDYIKLIKDKI